MTEAEFSRKLVTYFNKLVKTHFIKTHGTYFSAGVPDLIGSLRKIPTAIELKVYDLPKRDSTVMDITKDVTPLQRHKLKTMAKGGWDCWIAVLIRPINLIVWVGYNECPKFRKSELVSSAFRSPRPDFPDTMKELNSLISKL